MLPVDIYATTTEDRDLPIPDEDDTSPDSPDDEASPDSLAMKTNLRPTPVTRLKMKPRAMMKPRPIQPTEIKLSVDDV